MIETLAADEIVLPPPLRGVPNAPGVTPRQRVVSELISDVERTRIDTEDGVLVQPPYLEQPRAVRGAGCPGSRAGAGVSAARSSWRVAARPRRQLLEEAGL